MNWLMLEFQSHQYWNLPDIDTNEWMSLCVGHDKMFSLIHFRQLFHNFVSKFNSHGKQILYGWWVLF